MWFLWKVEQEVNCALSNGDIADDFEWPKTIHNTRFYVLSVPSYILNSNCLQVHKYAIWNTSTGMTN